MKKVVILVILLIITLSSQAFASNYYFNRDSSGIYQNINYLDSRVDIQDLSYSVYYTFKGRLSVGLEYDFLYDYISNIIYFPDSYTLINQIGLDINYALLKQTPTALYGENDKKFISINVGTALRTNEIASAIAGKISFTHKVDWENKNGSFDIYRSMIWGLFIDLEFYKHKVLYSLPVSSFSMNYSLQATAMLKRFCITARFIMHITDTLSDQYAYRDYNALEFSLGYLIPIRIRKKHDS